MRPRGAADHSWPSPAPMRIGVAPDYTRGTLDTGGIDVNDDDQTGAAPFLEPGSATPEDFERLDLRVGRVLSAAPLEGARKPAYRLEIDFGPGGTKMSSAQLTRTYPDPDRLVGRLVVAVLNFPPRRVAGFRSDVLVLGALAPGGHIPLLSVDEGAAPGQRVG
jgi:tRNA-binding protein